MKRINLLAAAMVLGPAFWADGAGAAQSRAAAAEQPYPARPVRMIVASAPGGGADIIAQGNDPVASTPEAFAKQIRAELNQWGKLVRQLGLKLQE